jgi:chemotaxis protein CheZ
MLDKSIHQSETPLMENNMDAACQTGETIRGKTAHALKEVDLLMREGLRRIANAHTDFPEARHPLEEALRLSEEQAMSTLDAVDAGRAAIREIRAMDNAYIDGPLARVEEAFSTIFHGQQGQDLAGQRLKKAMALMTAVQDRVSAVLRSIPLDDGEESSALCATGTEPCEAAVGQGSTMAQNDVDDLLSELGI